MAHITFIQPRNAAAEMYVNPLELQRLAGFIRHNNAGRLSVTLLDLNVQGTTQIDLSSILSATDLLIVGTPAGSIDFIKTMPVDSYLDRGGLLVFVGETVTDGLPEPLLREFWVPGHLIVAFSGMAESGFELMTQSLLEDNTVNPAIPDIHWIDAYGTYHQGRRSVHAHTLVAVEPFFPSDIVDEIRRRGLFALLDGLTRGCEHYCSYCRLNNSKHTSGRVQTVDARPVKVMEQLSHSLGRQLYVQFRDENFFGGRTPEERKQRLTEIRRLAAELIATGFLGMIGIDTRADTVIDLREDKEVARERIQAWRELVAAGLRYAYLGIESFSKRQLKRYSKRLDLECVLPAFTFLDSLNVSYTIGLIILDPLVSLEEIQDSVSFIERHGLYHSAASLLKEMRVGVRSPYYRLLSNASSSQHRPRLSNFLYLDSNSVAYADARVAEVVPITRAVHSLFAENGYRHSDLAVISSIGRYEPGHAIRQIPELVGRMEVDIWKYLISSPGISHTAKKVDVFAICRNSLSQIRLALHHSSHLSSTDPTRRIIRDYYLRVFERVELAFDRLVSE